STNRPFAVPGDFVELDVRQTLCDGASTGFPLTPADYVVTLVFTPPANGPRRAVVLTTSPCASLATQLNACGAAAKGGVSCRQVTQAGSPTALDVVSRPDGNHLLFRFPDPDDLAPAGTTTLAGPVTIAVTAATDTSLPCDLATTPCAAKQGVLACVDDLYDAD